MMNTKKKEKAQKLDRHVGKNLNQGQQLQNEFLDKFETQLDEMVNWVKERKDSVGLLINARFSNQNKHDGYETAIACLDARIHPELAAACQMLNNKDKMATLLLLSILTPKVIF